MFMNMNGFLRITNNLKTIRSELFSRDECGRNRLHIFFNQMAFSNYFNLMLGNYLIGLVLYMGASKLYLGLLVYSGTIGVIFQVFSPIILERFETRKKLLIIARGSATLLLLSSIIFPWLLPQGNMQKALFFIFFGTGHLLIYFFGPGFAAINIQSIPSSIRVSFFNFINVVNPIFLYCLLLLCSIILDYYKAREAEIIGFLILRLIAFLFFIVYAVSFYKIKEFPYKKPLQQLSIKNVFSIIYTNKEYLKNVKVVMLYTFTVGLPGPYFTAYMLENLGITYSYLSILTMIYLPLNIILTPLWSKHVAKRTMIYGISLGMFIYSIAYIIHILITKSTLPFLIIIYLLTFSASSLLTLCFSNLPYINLPEENKTSYLAFYNSLNSISALISIVISGTIIALLEKFKLEILGFPIYNVHLIMIISSVTILIAALYIGKMKIDEVEIT